MKASDFSVNINNCCLCKKPVEPPYYDLSDEYGNKYRVHESCAEEYMEICKERRNNE